MNVKIHLETAGAVVAAEGSADFVNGVVEQWSHLLDAASLPQHSASSLGQTEVGAQKVDDASSSQGPEQQYENVFALHNEKLKVIADIPGNSKAEVTRVAAQTLLFGEYLRGNETVTAENIKAVCLDHGSYDSSNFASHLKSLKSKVVMDAKPGGDYTVKLTAPGRKAAKEVVEALERQGS